MTGQIATPDQLALRRRFDELMGRHRRASDVRTGELLLDGVPALEVTIDGVTPEGTLLWIHGGAFLSGSARIGLAPAAAIARTSRMRVLSIDYPLAPEHPHPAAIEIGRTALRAAMRDAEAPVALGGESAGGAIALGVLIGERDAGRVLPVSAVIWSPVTDLTLAGASYVTKAEVDPAISTELVRTAADAYLAGADPQQATASPLFADLRGLPPLLIQAGSHEVLLDDATRIAVRAAADDVEVVLEVYPGRTHVFQSDVGTDPIADRAAASAGRFLREHER